MKKKTTLIASLSLLTALSGFSVIGGMNIAKAENVTNNISFDDTLMSTNFNLTNSDGETVYLITDANGKVKKSYIGNTLNQDFIADEIPVKTDVKYYLNGEEISANDIAGKTGKTTIKINYASEKSYNGTKIPFVAISGTMFKSTNFKNVEVSNGKVIDDGTNTTIVGLGFAGINEDLGLTGKNTLPESIEINADVTDFKLDTIYTIATNSVFSDLDTSKLNTVDDIIASVNKLSDSLDQILEGSDKITKGLDELLAKSNALASGISKLNDGANKLASNNETINSAITTIYTRMIATVDTSMRATLAQYAIPQTVIDSIPTLTSSNYQAVLDSLISNYPTYSTAFTKVKTTIDDYTTFYSVLNTNFAPKLKDYTDGVSALATNINTLNSNTPALIAGVTQLDEGAHSLTDGLSQFKSQGIEKLSSAANNDVSGLSNNIRKMVAVSKTYTHYKTQGATSTKFVFKTSSIK